MSVVFKSKDGTQYTASNCPDKLLTAYANSDKATPDQVEAAVEELTRRAESGEVEPPNEQEVVRRDAAKGRASAALAKVPSTGLVSSNTTLINERLAMLAENCNMLTPTTIFGEIPEGHEIQVLVRKIDLARDTIDIEGKAMLSSDACMDVTKYLGFKWVSVTRMSPYEIRDFWEYQAKATVLDVDGTIRELIGTYELDLREGSAAEQTLKPGMYNTRRINGARIAETGAMNRCLRAYGFKRSEKAINWQKPLVCVRLIARRPASESIAALYPHAPTSQPIDVNPESDGEALP
jgi:hypothetical protein